MSDDPFAEPTDSERTDDPPASGRSAAARRGAPPPVRSVKLGRRRSHALCPSIGTNPAGRRRRAGARRGDPHRGRTRQPQPDPDLLSAAWSTQVRKFRDDALATGLDTRAAARRALRAVRDNRRPCAEHALGCRQFVVAAKPSPASSITKSAAATASSTSSNRCSKDLGHNVRGRRADVSLHLARL